MYADCDLNHPEVREDFFNWAVWITEELGSAGFRFDAARHMDEKFLSDLVQHVRDKTGKSLFGVGEFFTEDLGSLLEYLDKFSAQISLFDCPLQDNFKRAGDEMEKFDLTKIFDGSLVQARPLDAGKP
jgi:alpha-amylase